MTITEALELCVSYFINGRIDDADSIIQKLLLSESYFPYVAEFALQKLNNEELKVAEYLTRALIKHNPRYLSGFNTLGVLLKKMSRYDEAINAFQYALDMSPSFSVALMNMGNLYLEIDEVDKALGCFDKVIQIDSRDVDAYRLKALCMSKKRFFDDAIVLLRQAIELDGNRADIIYDLAAMYYNLKKYDRSLENVEILLSREPYNNKYLWIKARILTDTGSHVEAAKILEEVLSRDKDYISAIIALGNIYQHAFNDIERSKVLYMDAYTRNPENIEIIEAIIITSVLTMYYSGERDDLGVAVSFGEKILNLAKKHKNYGFCLQNPFLESLSYDAYDKLGSQKDIMNSCVKRGGSAVMVLSMSRVKSMEDRINVLECHKAWGEQVELLASKKPIKRKVSNRLNSKIRVGMFSSYLNNTPVGYFAWPVIEKIDRTKFELYCYSASPDFDEVRSEMEKMADKFTSYGVSQSSDEVAESMLSDNLDIVFEMGGITVNNRMEAFAHKLAPIQVSWLGYPQSVGLPTAIDYIVVDPYIMPEDSRLIIEKPFMMPETWVAIDKVGFSNVEIIPKIPEDREGVITFGTLNAAYKYTRESIAVWAEIMNMVPNSRFLCVRQIARYELFRNNFIKHMAQHGISKDRISFIATDVNHLRCYNHIDIALDTFPHTGGTTTCETLWMGVPVVTLVGPCFFERISYSNLMNVGLSDLCAFSIDEYKEIALKLVLDKDRRRYLRTNLRKEILKHPLGQPNRFVKEFERKILDVLGK